MENLFEQQLKREQLHTIAGLDEHNSLITKMRGQLYFSGTNIGRKFRADNIVLLRQALIKDFNELKKGISKEKGAERHKAIRKFLEILTCMVHSHSGNDSFKLSEEATAYHEDQLFSLLAHITLTAMLDNSMAFYGGHLKPDGKLKDPHDRGKKTCYEVEQMIGKEFIFQVKLYLMNFVNPMWVKFMHEMASNKGKASKYYHHYNIKRLLRNYRAQAVLNQSRVENGEPLADGVTPEMVARDVRVTQALHMFHQLPPNADKFLGDWARSVLMDPETGINAFCRGQVTISSYATDKSTGYSKKGADGKNKKETKLDMMFYPVPHLLAKWDKVHYDKDRILDDLEQEYTTQLFAFSKRMPMLIPPQDITQDFIGGWLHDTAGSPGCDHKGGIEFGEDHLDFYNKQQGVAFKLDPWIHELMTELRNENSDSEPVKLGSFKPHVLVTPPTVFDLAYKHGYRMPKDFSEMTYDQQTENIKWQLTPETYNDVVKERAILWNRQHDLVKDGVMSLIAYEHSKTLIDLERFYLPVTMDFRGRVVQRCFPINYQGPDHCKALLKFADSVPVDDDNKVKKSLLVQIANTMGEKLDKLSYESRYSEVLKRKDKIIAIAEMLDYGPSAFNLGLQVLKDIKAKGGKPWQCAQACREYYLCIIKGTKKTTDLICTIDGSSSGQQIASVWLRSKELATKTNVRNTPDGVPSDLYQVIADKMISLLKVDGKAFNRGTQDKLNQDSNMRTLVKSGFQAGQYAAGINRQHISIRDKMKELEKEVGLKFIEDKVVLVDGKMVDEKTLFCHYYTLALENVCQLGVLIDWFKSLCHMVYENEQPHINVITPINTALEIRYQPQWKRRTRTYSYGDTVENEPKTIILTEHKEEDLTVSQIEERLNKWITSLLPNVTHCCDAQLIALALHDAEFPFTTCHDSIGAHAGENMDLLRDRLRKAMVTLSQFDIFKELAKANDIPENLLPAPLQGGWDTIEEDILNSDYMFS